MKHGQEQHLVETDQDLAKNLHSFVEDTQAKLETLSKWICDAKTILWFTGAGISTESGTPDFRGPDGIWTREDKKLPPHEMMTPLEEIEPNPAHYAIVQFEKIGKCDFLVSQNCDNLHLKSGFPLEKLAELHGNINRLRCRTCNDRTFPIENFPNKMWGLNERMKRELTDACPICGGPLEDSVIDFGDSMPVHVLDTAFEWAERADLTIVVGSSCQVYPAADIPRANKKRGDRLVIMNIGETGLDDICDLRFSHEKVGKLLPKLLQMVLARLNNPPTEASSC